jgi:ribosomal protein S21
MNPKKLREFQHILPGSPLGALVQGDELNHAIQSWKRRVKNSGLLRELYDRREFVKPSVARRKLITDAAYKQKKLSGMNDA